MSPKADWAGQATQALVSSSPWTRGQPRGELHAFLFTLDHRARGPTSRPEQPSPTPAPLLPADLYTEVLGEALFERSVQIKTTKHCQSNRALSEKGQAQASSSVSWAWLEVVNGHPAPPRLSAAWGPPPPSPTNSDLWTCLSALPKPTTSVRAFPHFYRCVSVFLKTPKDHFTEDICGYKILYKKFEGKSSKILSALYK